MPKRNRTKPKPSDICFVLMPFSGFINEYYASIYKPAIEASNLTPVRADDLFRPSTIVNDIWDHVKRSKLLLADLTGKNPNVFYELGLAHALAKPVIMVAESMDDIPFDLRALRIILYDKNIPTWGEVLRTKIEASIVEVVESPANAVLPTFLNVKDSGPRPSVTPQEKELIELRQEMDSVRRELAVRRERPVDRSIGPDEAEQLIRDYMKQGMHSELITDRLIPLGPPRAWILDKIKEINAREARKISRISRVSSASVPSRAQKSARKGKKK